MRAVVTGATSFIGAAAIRQLLQAGHEVLAVVRPESSKLENLYSHIPAGTDDTHGDLAPVGNQDLIASGNRIYSA